MTNAATAAFTCAATTTVANEMVFGVFGNKGSTETYTAGTHQTNLNTETTTSSIDAGVDTYTTAAISTARSVTLYENDTTSDDAGGACIGLLPTNVPIAPGSLAQSAATTTTVTYTWTNPKAPLANDTSYEFTGAACTSTLTATSLGVVTTNTVTGIASATSVYEKVSAWNSTGESAHTACVTATTLPTAPTISSATPASTTSVTVAWSNPSGTLTDDYVYYQQSGTCSAPTQDNIGSVTTSATVTGLTTNKEYLFLRRGSERRRSLSSEFDADRRNRIRPGCTDLPRHGDHHDADGAFHLVEPVHRRSPQ